jgi:hypothetical protein
MSRKRGAERMMTPRDAYAAIDAVLLAHVYCRPGLDDPGVSPTLVAL